MSVFAAYERGGRWQVVPDRSFSLPAFVFGPFWLLRRGAIAMACAAGAAELLSGGIARLALAVCLGLFGHELCRLELRLDGFRHRRDVVAPGPDAALRRLADSTVVPGAGARGR
jgi:hypothetical protein